MAQNGTFWAETDIRSRHNSDFIQQKIDNRSILYYTSPFFEKLSTKKSFHTNYWFFRGFLDFSDTGRDVKHF